MCQLDIMARADEGRCGDMAHVMSVKATHTGYYRLYAGEDRLDGIDLEVILFERHFARKIEHTEAVGTRRKLQHVCNLKLVRQLLPCFPRICVEFCSSTNTERACPGARWFACIYNELSER